MNNETTPIFPEEAAQQLQSLAERSQQIREESDGKKIFRETDYGFIYGSLEITRIMSDDKKGWVVIEAKTGKTKINIYSTRTGKVRIHKDGVELT